MGHPLLKNEAPELENNPPPPPLKSESRFQEMIPRKQPEKLETVINTCISLIKQHWQKMAEILQKCDFLTWSIQNFVRKVRQFIRKYYIT